MGQGGGSLHYLSLIAFTNQKPKNSCSHFDSKSFQFKCHSLGHGQNLILTQVEPYGFVDLGQVQLLLSSTFDHGLRRKHFLVVSVENQFGSDSVIHQK